MEIWSCSASLNNVSLGLSWLPPRPPPQPALTLVHHRDSPTSSKSSFTHQAVITHQPLLVQIPANLYSCNLTISFLRKFSTEKKVHFRMHDINLTKKKKMAKSNPVSDPYGPSIILSSSSLLFLGQFYPVFLAYAICCLVHL